jgi:integrase
MAFLTGMRQNELTTLKWNDVDIDRGLITLSNFGSITKTAKIRSIPLCTQAIELLKKDIYQGQMIMYLQPYLVKNG